MTIHQFMLVSDTLQVAISGYDGPVSEGGSLNLTCQADALQPQYTWQQRFQDGKLSFLSDNSLLHFSKLLPSDSGVYICRAEISDAFGEKNVQVFVKPLMSTAQTTESGFTSITEKGM